MFRNLIGYVPSWAVIRKPNPSMLSTLTTRQEISADDSYSSTCACVFGECARIESLTLRGSPLIVFVKYKIS